MKWGQSYQLWHYTTDTFAILIVCAQNATWAEITLPSGLICRSSMQQYPFCRSISSESMFFVWLSGLCHVFRYYWLSPTHCCVASGEDGQIRREVFKRCFLKQWMTAYLVSAFAQQHLKLMVLLKEVEDVGHLAVTPNPCQQPHLMSSKSGMCHPMHIYQHWLLNLTSVPIFEHCH